MSDNIIFSIVIATYNRGEIIGDTLKSLLDQSYCHFEIIVVDDGSKDNTGEILNAWCLKDQRIKYFPITNGERGRARNHGIANCTGQYISFIDSDDISYPFALENALIELKKYNWPMCYAQAYEVRDKASGKLVASHKYIKENTINKTLFKGNFLSCIGVFIKREVFNEVKFEEDRNFAGTEDWLLWLQISARYPIYYSNRVCAALIEHQNRSVLNFPEDKLAYRAEFLKGKLLEDSVVVNKFGLRQVNRLYAHVLTYVSLHLAMSKKRKRALHYLLKAAVTDYRELLSLRTLGIFKTIII